MIKYSRDYDIAKNLADKIMFLYLLVELMKYIVTMREWKKLLFTLNLKVFFREI